MKKALSIVIASVFLLLCWQLASMALDKAFLPGPVTSFRAFVDLCIEGKMWPQFCISALRVLGSTALGVLLAVPLGMACGRSERLYQISTPLVAILPIAKSGILANSCGAFWLGKSAESGIDYIDHFLSDFCGGVRCGTSTATGKCRLYAHHESAFVRRFSAFIAAGLSAIGLDLFKNLRRQFDSSIVFCRNICFF